MSRHQGLAPVWSPEARLLILGSFPGTASLAAQQYYAHPRNQFWPIVGRLIGCDLPALPYPERLQALHAHGVALWDIYAGCVRVGSLDSAIRDAQPNDLTALIAQMPRLNGVAHNGATSARASRVLAPLGLPLYALPSTSPAFAAWTFERKCAAWRVAFDACCP